MSRNIEIEGVTEESNMDSNHPVVSKSYSHSYSTSTKSRTTTSATGEPHTVTETSTSTSTSGDPDLSTALPYDDGFEELKKSILSGDAYRQKIEEIKAKPGFPQFKPVEGATVIRPVTVSNQHSFTTYQSSNGAAPSISVPVQQAPPATTSQQPPHEMNPFYKTELQIPVRRYHNTFDDFFMNRFHENSGSLMDAEMASRRSDWESRLDNMKRDFFKFSPFDDSQHKIESSQTVNTLVPYGLHTIGNPIPLYHTTQQNYSKRSRTTTTTSSNTTRTVPLIPLTYFSPTGKPEFAVQFDVKNFSPDEVKVSTKHGKLEITACHEEKHGTSSSRREFKRTVDLPKDVQIGLMKSILSKDGILSVTAPIQPPNYQPPAIASSGRVTQQHATAVSSAPAPSASSGQIVTRGVSSHGDAMNYSMSVAGYMPQEVSVTVEGSKVKVHAKHDEIARGKKTHNEMTKTFDLPPSVDARHVRSFINNDTLYIEAHLRDDLAGLDLRDPFYMTELHIPIRRHHNTFDDFFMNRFQDMSDLMGADMSSKLAAWKKRLNNIKRDLFFNLSSFGDSPLNADLSNLVNVSPTGKPEFSVQLDVKNLNPNEVKVTSKNGELEVTGKVIQTEDRHGHHEGNHGTSKNQQQFRRSWTLPKNVQVGLLKCVLSKDGILSITAPIQPPAEMQHARSGAGSSQGEILRRAPSSTGETLNYGMSVAGYMPREITVTVKGNKVKVHATHDGVAQGKKTHKEMTETFDLPPTVDAHGVRCYFNNDTLYIEARLQDGAVGKIHVVPVHHKS